MLISFSFFFFIKKVIAKQKKDAIPMNESFICENNTETLASFYLSLVFSLSLNVCSCSWNRIVLFLFLMFLLLMYPMMGIVVHFLGNKMSLFPCNWLWLQGVCLYLCSLSLFHVNFTFFFFCRFHSNAFAIECLWSKPFHYR